MLGMQAWNEEWTEKAGYVRTGASPGALPSVCPLALEAPSPCSEVGLAWQEKGWWGNGEVCYFRLAASRISRWRLSRRGFW